MRNSKRRAGSQWYYWITINGTSAAMSPISLPITVKCSPTPQVLIGFDDQGEAMTTRRILLTAPIPEARELLTRLHDLKF
jgi:hypothetical protein